ncbi:MAG: 50S ribosomal protein L21 [Candidatus Eisenbacteria bacterium]|nr:50S ribosomal protein L21 [Candidatus Eisenbacteria bacterium]
MSPEGLLDYAIIRSGGLQYRVSRGDTVRVPRVGADVGEKLEIDEVLAVRKGDDLNVGTPLLEGVSVSAEVVKHGQGKKVIVFKKKRRKGYQVKKGHRQGYTELRITGISA